jgi:hypothetical protein
MEVRGPHERIYRRILSVCFRYFRRRRVRFIWKTLPMATGMRVLDLGGQCEFWRVAEGMGLPVPDVTIVNVLPPTERLPPNITSALRKSDPLVLARSAPGQEQHS